MPRVREGVPGSFAVQPDRVDLASTDRSTATVAEPRRSGRESNSARSVAADNDTRSAHRLHALARLHDLTVRRRLDPGRPLTAILLLTLTPWVGVYPGGTAVYTQGAWRSITGRPTRNFQNEDLMLKELPAPSVYDRTVSDWLIMLPYIVALLLAIVLAWAERLEKSGASTRLPKLLPALWPFRHLVIAGLVGAALLLLTLEATRGFGLERAMHAAVTDKFDTQRKDAKTPGEHHRIDYLEGKELAGFGLERTGWFCLVLSLHILAIVAMLGRVGLERRGNKPPPRIALQY